VTVIGATGVGKRLIVVVGRGVDTVGPGLNDIGAADGVEPVHAARVSVPARAAVAAGMIRLMGQGPPFDSVLR
jgi:hypothetical protein